MSNKERIFAYLTSISPRSATNGDLAKHLSIHPHQQVFQITQQLMGERRIQGRRFGKEWEFWADTVVAKPATGDVQVSELSSVSRSISPSHFEKVARVALEAHYQKSLIEGQIPNIPKRWDYLSADSQIVGDAKYYTMVGGERFPPAKMSIIAEHVWLLSRTPAANRFLIFGSDRRVPETWLQRYGHLADGIAFWFLAENAGLELLRHA